MYRSEVQQFPGAFNKAKKIMEGNVSTIELTRAGSKIPYTNLVWLELKKLDPENKKSRKKGHH